MCLQCYCPKYYAETAMGVFLTQETMPEGGILTLS